MNNQVITVEISEEVAVEVQPDESHQWLISSKDVAEGYGLSDGGLRSSKSKNAEELKEGKHYITVANRNGGAPKTMWTKKGVIRLGFLIKTPLAKQFRDWAEDFIIKKSEEAEPKAPVIPQTYIEALEDLIAKEKLLIKQAPIVQAYQELTHQNINTINDMTISEVAKELGWKPKSEFIPMLRRAGVIFKKGTEPKSTYTQKGWFRGTPYNKRGFAGIVWKVTPKGMAGMLKKFGRRQNIKTIA